MNEDRTTGRGRGSRWLLVAAAAVLLVALSPPAEAISSTLFSAHMVQHLALLLVVPLLLIAGTAREMRLSSALTSPLTVGALQIVVMWFWHLPVFYDAAVDNVAVHVLEHASFLVAGVLFWVVVIGRGREHGHLTRVGLVFATALQSSALGALIAFATGVLYSSHLSSTARFDLTPLEDQQLAGAIMWVPPGVVYLVIMLVLLAKAFKTYEHVRTEEP